VAKRFEEVGLHLIERLARFRHRGVSFDVGASPAGAGTALPTLL